MAIDLNQPQVMAAIVGGSVAAVVSLIVAAVNQLSLRSMHRQKLDVDRDLAERRVNAEIALTERKIAADIALAEKRLTLDRALAAWRRRSDLAEETLADFYRARDIIKAARSPVSLHGEGSTRRKQERESEDESRVLNSFYAPVERLRGSTEFFAQVHARRYRFTAIFGAETTIPYNDIFQLREDIFLAAEMLIETYHEPKSESLIAEKREWRRTIWGGHRDDDVLQKLDHIVAAIEETCRPAIQEGAQ